MDPEQFPGRIKHIHKSLESIASQDSSASPENNDRLACLTDEAVFILLSILKVIVKQNRWVDVTPLQLFEGVYCGLSGWSWAAILARFKDTQQLVHEYQTGDRYVKKSLKPKLVSRGII